MKNKSSLLLLLAVVLIQCSEKKPAQEQSMPAADTVKVTSAAAPQFNVAAEFQQQLSAFFAAYVLLKESLVASDVPQVQRQAEAAQQTFKKIDMHLLSGPAHHDWMTYVADLESSLGAIQVSTDLAAQRTAFSVLSQTLYKSIKAYGLKGTTVYYDFCPMAFNNKGGYWLSDQEKIRNPYFGEQMLTCGSIRETLK